MTKVRETKGKRGQGRGDGNETGGEGELRERREGTEVLEGLHLRFTWAAVSICNLKLT